MSEESPPKALVLGLGSAHGDDQLGWVLIDRIRDRLPADCVAGKGTNALEWLERVEGLQTLVIVDASAPAGSPGRVRSMSWPIDALEHSDRLSSHGPSLLETFQLAEVLGRMPPRVRVFTVEAARCTPGEDMSHAIAAQVEPIIDAILDELALRSDQASCLEA